MTARGLPPLAQYPCGGAADLVRLAGGERPVVHLVGVGPGRLDPERPGIHKPTVGWPTGEWPTWHAAVAWLVGRLVVGSRRGGQLAVGQLAVGWLAVGQLAVGQLAVGWRRGGRPGVDPPMAVRASSGPRPLHVEFGRLGRLAAGPRSVRLAWRIVRPAHVRQLMRVSIRIPSYQPAECSGSALYRTCGPCWRRPTASRAWSHGGVGLAFSRQRSRSGVATSIRQMTCPPGRY